MKPVIVSLVLAFCTIPHACLAQFGGNASYSQSSNSDRAAQNEHDKRQIGPNEMPPNGTCLFIEASVLMNVKADEYVAVFGVMQEGATVAECNQKMDATVKEFVAQVKKLGIGGDAVFVDFVAQNKIYGYTLSGDVAKEQLTGFELKKNVIVRFQDKALLDRLLVLAAQSKIYDLVKVDYVVKDTPGIQSKALEAATQVVKRKAAQYEKLLGITLLPPAQVYAEKPSIYYPSEMYNSYTASESENINTGYDKQKYTVQQARKSRTFYYDALNANGFDAVINPVVVEPVVQFTEYLKVKYEIAQPKAQAAR